MSLPILRCALAGVLFATLARGQTDTIAPSVPSGVVASAVGVGGFSLAWNAATDNVAVARYEVFRGGVSLGTTTAVSFAVTGLAPNTAYAMRVRAGDAAGNWSAQSLALTVRTLPDTSAPSTPTGLAAGAVTATGFTLAWSASGDNVGVTLYEVFRNGASLGTTVALDKAVTKLSPLTAYTLTVRARDAAGNWSAQSAALSVTTAPDTTPPAAPAGLMASSVTATGLTLRWSVAADDVRTTAYEISRDGVSLGTTSALAKTLAGLSPLTTYRLTVRARDAAGNWSPLSAPLDLATTADTTAPSAPTGLAASAVTIAGFQLRWNAAADNVGATAYEVFRDGVSLGTTAGTTLAVTGLALSTSYSMTVRARDAAGNWSALSTPRVVTTLADTTPPSVPTGLVATAITLGSFTLTWSASADNVGVTAYEVFRGASSLGTTPGLSLDVTGLAPNIAYSMRVRARDAAGRWSAQSAPLVVRTLADTTPPTAPAGLAASGVTVTALTLTWAPAADDIGTTAYEVFRNGMSLGTTAAPTKAIVGLMPATDYTFTVRARDAAGNRSDLSVALVVTTLPDTTPPSVPAGLAASSVGVASFKLTWAAAADDVRTTGYEVFRDGTSVGVTLGLARNVSGLVPATAYALTVRARDAAGNWSAPSAPLTVTTLPDTTPPAVPAGLVASAIGTTGFTLRWSVPRDDVHTTAYEIFRDGVSLGTTTTAVKVLTGLAPDTDYTMTVRASDAAGNWSAPSAPLAVSTLADITPPSVPAAVTASAITATGLTLGWSAASDGVGVTGYEIFQDGVPVATAGGTSVAITGLSPFTTYSFRVRAGDAAGNWSALSTARTARTLADTTAPSVPAGLAASNVTGTSLTLSWNAATDNVAVAAYEVFRGGVSQGTTAGLSLDLAGLTLNTAYAFRVRARDAAGNWSAQGAALAVTTFADTQPPTVPDGLAVSAVTMEGFVLSWTAATDDVAVTAYEVFRNGTSIGTTAVPTFTVAGLVRNTTYSMTVRARDAAGNWSATSTAFAATTAGDNTPPSVPDGLAATNFAPTGFTVSWNAAVDDLGVTGYEIFVNGTSAGTTGTTSFSVGGLATGALFNVTVRARDAAGNWSASSAPLAVRLNRLPYVTGFEAADGYAPGPLNGQQGWLAEGTASVVVTSVHAGQQAVELAPAASLSFVAREFANADPRVTFVDFYARPAAGASAGTGQFFETESTALALASGVGGAALFAYDGDGHEAGGWVAISAALALDGSGRCVNWHRFTVRTDYAAKRWDLYLDGRMVAGNLGLLDNTVAAFASLGMTGHATLATQLDDVLAGFAHPIFADANNDGLDDAWELAHGFSLAAGNRDGDADGDGVSNLLELIAGTNPRDYYNGIAPAFESLVVGGQAGAQGLVSVRLTRPADGAPLANAPVALSVTTGIGLIAGTPGGPASMQVTVRTDAQGIARGYVTFVASAGTETLVATAPVGTPPASLSVALVPPPVVPPTAGLRLWLKADVGVTADGAARVSAWGDQSGRAQHAVQSGPDQQPQLIQAALNGQPVIRFDGSGRYLGLPDALSGASQGEIFAILRARTVPSDRSRIPWSFGGSTGAAYPEGRALWDDFGSATQWFVGATAQDLASGHLYNASSRSGEWIARINGVELFASAANTVSFRSNPLLGRTPQFSGDYFFDGDIAEIMVFDRVLSAAERLAVGAYLNQKYALESALPSAPSAVRARAVAPGQVALTWAGPQANALYEFERRVEGAVDFVPLATVANALSHVDAAAPPAVACEYRVRARNLAGPGPYATTSVTAVLPATLAAMPLANLRQWLRADAGINSPAGITRWRDQGALGHHAHQITAAAQPAIVAGALNGRPIVRFNGINHFLNLPDLMAGAAAGELFVVLSASSIRGDKQDAPWALGSTHGAQYPYRDSRLYDDFGSNTQWNVGLIDEATVTSPRLYNATSAPGRWVARLDAIERSVQTANTVAFRSNPLMGRNPMHPDYYFAGDLAELLVFDRALTDGERHAVGRYLADKYALDIPRYRLGLDDPNGDLDGDGLTNLQEVVLHFTDPAKADTDGDGVPDGAEILFGTNPIIADATADPDGDGLTNAEEIALGSAPTTPAAPATAGALKLRLFLPR